MLLSLDPGTKNLGWCVIDNIDGQLVAFGVITLEKSKLFSSIETLAAHFCAKYVLTEVVIERQMRGPMIRVEGALRFAFSSVNKVRVITPQAVRRYFDYSGLSYAKMKKRGVVITKVLLEEMGQSDFFIKALSKRKSKMDDLCDAFLQARYAFDASGRTKLPAKITILTIDSNTPLPSLRSKKRKLPKTSRKRSKKRVKL